MKKIFKKIGKFFAKVFKVLYRIIDVILVTPISKAVYFVGDKLSSKNGNLDQFLNNQILLYMYHLYVRLLHSLQLIEKLLI